jgi:hypothetical protein
MGDDNTQNITTEQVKTVPNPTGKGGFGDHPENISPGGWDKNNSYSYWMHYFKSLTIDEFRGYKTAHPEMTMAALGAYARVAKSIDDRGDFQEVANRTEGMPKQTNVLEGSSENPLVIIKSNGNNIK